MPYKDKEKQRESARKWAAKNRDVTNKHRDIVRRQVRGRVQEIKEASPCTDCGNHYPYYVMQFDHLHSKTASINHMVKDGTAWAKVEKEIAKCELVCGNCHSIRTFERNTSSPVDG